MALDLDKIAAGVNPSGLDPEIEKKAEEYAKRDWQMSIKPMLDAVFKPGTNDELPIQTIADLQNALFEHKYDVLLNADNKKAEAAKNNLRW
jgi:hypothetical protein